MFAVVRVRGDVNIGKEIKKTLEVLRLRKRNHCALFQENKSVLGMLNKAKDYVTWGGVSKPVLEKLLRKRGRLSTGERLDEEYVKEELNSSIEEFSEELIEGEASLEELPGLKKLFKLNPPKKGFARGGITLSYANNGALGYRGEEINSLLRKMM